jgi:hypothetical protein
MQVKKCFSRVLERDGSCLLYELRLPLLLPLYERIEPL